MTTIATTATTAYRTPEAVLASGAPGISSQRAGGAALDEARSEDLPRSVGLTAEFVCALRGDEAKLMRFFDRSPVPMLFVDDERRYVDVNRPARLIFRLSLAEMRRLTVEDLTPPSELPTLEAAWARLMETGCVAGPYHVAGPDGGSFDVVYWALANALPGLHLATFALADWPEEELGLLEEDIDPPPAPLTPRELDVLQLAAEGLSGPRIAERLVVAPSTVKTHFSNIYAKLRARDRSAAVAKGLRLGLIE